MIFLVQFVSCLLYFVEKKLITGSLGPRKNVSRSLACLSELDHSGNYRINHVFRLAESKCYREAISKCVTCVFVTLVSCEVKFKSKLVLFSGVLLISRMDELNELKGYGESLGLNDSELTDFIKQQQGIQRGERQAQRERELEKIKLNSQAEIEKERLNFDLEREKMKTDIEKMKIEKQSNIFEEAKFKIGHVSPKIPKLPVFDDSHDEMNIFLSRFEK